MELVSVQMKSLSLKQIGQNENLKGSISSILVVIIFRLSFRTYCKGDEDIYCMYFRYISLHGVKLSKTICFGCHFTRRNTLYHLIYHMTVSIYAVKSDLDLVYDVIIGL